MNSLHVQGVSTLGENVTVEALSDDGVVEAISVKDSPGFAVGVQWHLEWQEEDWALDKCISEEFLATCKDRNLSRKDTSKC